MGAIPCLLWFRSGWHWAIAEALLLAITPTTDTPTVGSYSWQGYVRPTASRLSHSVCDTLSSLVSIGLAPGYSRRPSPLPSCYHPYYGHSYRLEKSWQGYVRPIISRLSHSFRSGWHWAIAGAPLSAITPTTDTPTVWSNVISN